MHVEKKTLPKKHLRNKQIDPGREAVFLGYSDKTTRQYWYYAPNLGYPQRSSSVDFNEATPGGLLDLRLRNLPSGVTGQGTSPHLLDRKPRGRPRKIVNVPRPTIKPIIEIKAVPRQDDLPRVPDSDDQVVGKESQDPAKIFSKSNNLPANVANCQGDAKMSNANLLPPTKGTPPLPIVQDADEMSGVEDSRPRYFLWTKRVAKPEEEEDRNAKHVKIILAMAACENEEPGEGKVERAFSAIPDHQPQ